MQTQSELAMLDYYVVDHVVQSWDKVKSLYPETYKEDIGVALVRKLVVESKTALSLLEGDEDVSIDDLCASKRFRLLSISVVAMMEMAIEMLGPDLDLVTEQLLQLGGRHARFGVSREQFEIVGAGLVIALGDALPEEHFQEKHKKSWQQFYAYVTEMMMEGEKRKRDAQENSEKKEEHISEQQRHRPKAEAAKISSNSDTESSHSSIDVPGPVSVRRQEPRRTSTSARISKMILNVRLMLSGRAS